MTAPDPYSFQSWGGGDPAEAHVAAMLDSAGTDPEAHVVIEAEGKPDHWRDIIADPSTDTDRLIGILRAGDYSPLGGRMIAAEYNRRTAAM